MFTWSGVTIRSTSIEFQIYCISQHWWIIKNFDNNYTRIIHLQQVHTSENVEKSRDNSTESKRIESRKKSKKIWINSGELKNTVESRIYKACKNTKSKISAEVNGFPPFMWPLPFPIFP